MDSQSKHLTILRTALPVDRAFFFFFFMERSLIPFAPDPVGAVSSYFNLKL